MIFTSPKTSHFSKILKMASVILISCGATIANSTYADAKLLINQAIDGLFLEQIDADRPGCSVAIRQSGQNLHINSYGVADIKSQAKLTPYTRFRIASVSKQFTAAAIAIAADKNYLNLDDPIGKYLPELSKNSLNIPIKQLINHSSGLPDYADDAFNTIMNGSFGREFDWDAKDYISTEDFYSVTTLVSPLKKYKNKFHYSNIGYFWLSQIIKQATGESLAKFAASNIFKPAKMSHSFFNDNAKAYVKNSASGHRISDQDAIEKINTNLDWIGDGGVYSNIIDMVRWMQQFEKPTLGRDAKKLRQTLISPVTRADKSYAYGLSIAHENEDQYIEHSGSWLGFVSLFRIYPDAKISYSILCNQEEIDIDDLADGIDDILLY